MGLPSIQIVIAENQNNISKILARNNAIKILQNISDLPKILSEVSDWMEKISNTSRKISDGQGVSRVLKVLMDKEL